MKFSILLSLLFVFSCGYEVEKRYVSIYEKLIREKNYETAVYEIAKSIEAGSDATELIFWLHEIETHVKENKQLSHILKEYDFELEENKLLQIKSQINDFEDKILKENQKNINTFVPLNEGETKEDCINKIAFYQREINFIRIDKNKLTREKKMIETNLEDFQKRVRQIIEDLEKKTALTDNEKKKLNEEKNELNKRIKNLKYQILELKKDIGFLSLEINNLRMELHNYKISRNVSPDTKKIQSYKNNISRLRNDRIEKFSKYLYQKILDSVENDYENDYDDVISRFYKNNKIKALIVSAV